MLIKIPALFHSVLASRRLNKLIIAEITKMTTPKAEISIESNKISDTPK